MRGKTIALAIKYKKYIKYLLSGGTAAAVDLLLLYFFTNILGIWYVASAVLAYILAFTVSFSLQKFWTFRDGSTKRLYRQLAVYFFVSLTNLFLNTILMYLFVDYLHIYYLLSQIIISALIAVSSYLIYNFIIFKKQALAVAND